VVGDAIVSGNDCLVVNVDAAIMTLLTLLCLAVAC